MIPSPVSLIIGRSMPRIDGYTKVCGSEPYAADHYPENLLYIGIVRSPHPHARIISIHTEKAESCEGIIAVLTGRDVKGTNRFGLPEMDQPVLADDKVRYTGDPVALVVAETPGQLPEAMAAVQVSYEPLPAIFDPAAAMRPDAPVLHEYRKDKNLLMSAHIATGDVNRGFAECRFTAEATFILPRQEHAYLETEAGVAQVRENGVLEMTVSTQTPDRDARELSDALGIPVEKIRVMAPYLGGAFGGKDGIIIQAMLGLAAQHAGGRPVRIHTTREESFLGSTKRHPAEVRYRIGCLEDGTLHALHCRAVYDTGAYAMLGGPVLVQGLNHAAGVYRIPHCIAEGIVVYTNNPVSNAFRGFGIPQINAGIEQAIDMLAEKAGIDPVGFRLKNAVRAGDEAGLGIMMSHSTGIVSCLETIRQHPLWTGRDEWIQKAPPRKRRGVGVAAAVNGMGYGPVIADYAGAKITMLPDGRFRIYSGVVDMGQGNNPTSVQIACGILNQNQENFELVQPDTFQGIPSCSSAGSRTTFTYGNALIIAANTIRDLVLDQVVRRNNGIQREFLSLLPGKVHHAPDGREFSLAGVASWMPESDRTVVARFTAPVNRQEFPIPDIVKMCGFPKLIYTYAAHLARVEIDELTGEVKIDAYLACTDAGRILNPQVAEQQVQGGVAQGIGYALYEDFQVKDGIVMTKNLSTYIIPSSRDLPDIISIMIDAHEEAGPFGLKGIGEIGISPPLPCISNAATGAIGERISRYPLTPERILTSLRRAK